MINKETIENVKAVQSSYDEAPYKSKTFYYTQPGRQLILLALIYQVFKLMKEIG